MVGVGVWAETLVSINQKLVSISILLYGQLLQVIGYIETRTDIKYDEKEDVVNMCKA